MLDTSPHLTSPPHTGSGTVEVDIIVKPSVDAAATETPSDTAVAAKTEIIEPQRDGETDQDYLVRTCR